MGANSRKSDAGEVVRQPRFASPRLPPKSKGFRARMVEHLHTLLDASAKSVGARMYSLIVLILLLAFGIPQNVAHETPKAIGTFTQAILKAR